MNAGAKDGPGLGLGLRLRRQPRAGDADDEAENCRADPTEPRALHGWRPLADSSTGWRVRETRAQNVPSRGPRVAGAIWRIAPK
jgi:hypothetical protein